MRVTAVSNTVHFGSKVNAQKRSVQYSPKYESIDDKKLWANSLALASIGMATLGVYMVVKKGWKPIDTLKKAKTIVQDKIHLIKRKKNPVEKVLNGERDAKALQRYKVYLADKKMKSLVKRIEKGEFKDAPTSVINNLRTNAINFAKITGNISQYIPN